MLATACLFSRKPFFPDIKVEPMKKQLHITLAYQYAGEHNAELVKLAQEIDPKADCQWEVRLYSRDPRLGKSEVSLTTLVVIGNWVFPTSCSLKLFFSNLGVQTLIGSYMCCCLTYCLY